jgi:SAM-dependent methyltransferase
MNVLNLGCGTKVSSHPNVTNIDWSIYLRLRKNPVLRRITPLIVSGERRRRFLSLPDNILVHDLARGIPFPDQSIDAVYHSHTLEHLDRATAKRFLSEVLRVLKPGGIHRIVVPDLERY